MGIVKKAKTWNNDTPIHLAPGLVSHENSLYEPKRGAGHPWLWRLPVSATKILRVYGLTRTYSNLLVEDLFRLTGFHLVASEETFQDHATVLVSWILSPGLMISTSSLVALLVTRLNSFSSINRLIPNNPELQIYRDFPILVALICRLEQPSLLAKCAIFHGFQRRSAWGRLEGRPRLLFFAITEWNPNRLLSKLIL